MTRRSTNTRRFASVYIAAVGGMLCLASCSSDDASGTKEDAGVVASERPLMSLDDAKNPDTCKTCHPNQYREWASSMHAYSSQDPVFVAMNKRGQRETNGQLGDFCLKCHAPMAVVDAKIQTGSDNLTALPTAYQGVTCYFCHNADSIADDHNATPHLTNDIVMRGPIRNPKQPGVHHGAYGSLMDDASADSNQLCGGCHDIVNTNGVHLERTFEEYKQSIFSKPSMQGGLSCASCHMDALENEPIADDPPSHVGVRTAHSHLWPGVDVALTDNFPDQAIQRQAVECNLANGTLTFSFDPNTDVTAMRASPGAYGVTIENQGGGHRQPSGASQDRRMWWETFAYDSTGKTLGQSGVIADGAIEEKDATDPTRDTQLWMFHDKIFDKNAQPTHNFWDAAPSTMYPSGYVDPPNTLPVPTDPLVPHFVAKTYRFPAAGSLPGQTARVVGHLRMRPMGMDVLQDLVASGDLDPSIPAKIPTFTMAGTAIDCDVSKGMSCTPGPNTLNCPNSYLCMLRPGSSYCDPAATSP